jgi:hypothetical protein
MRVLGQPLFLWEDPDGYPDDIDWWAGGILQRWNFAAYLTSLQRGAVAFDTGGLLGLRTAPDIVDAIDRRAFGGAMSDALRQRLVAWLGSTPSDASVREAFALALSAEEFQWY